MTGEDCVLTQRPFRKSKMIAHSRTSGCAADEKKRIAGMKMNFRDSFRFGDLWTRLSFVLFGAGYLARGQYIKGILLQLVQVFFYLFTFGFSLQYILKLGTLGTVQREEVFDPKTLSKVVNDYDNSLMILLCGIIGILFLVM